MIIKATNIVYDTDKKTAATLPKELSFEVDESWFQEDDLADLVSDETGFCVSELTCTVEA